MILRLSFVCALGLIAPLAASGQVLTLPPLELPRDEAVSPPPPTSPSDGIEELPPAAERTDASVLHREYGDEGKYLDSHGHDAQAWADPTFDDWGRFPVALESTGTWLRRGWWYSEVDAVILNRMWKRDDQVVAFDQQSFRNLQIGDTDPGAEANVRLTLGRFLFRDLANRDHMLEFSAFGGGEFSQSDTLTSRNGLGSLVVNQIYSNANLTFDGAESMALDYNAHFRSFELNYRVKGRPRRDRMEFMPSGQWVRRTNKGLTKHYLIGLRYFQTDETLNWTAENISSVAGEDGRYRIDTRNSMFGLQLGHSLLFDADRFSIEAAVKGGAYMNDAHADSVLDYSNSTTDDFVKNNREPTLAFLGEFQLIGRYHLRPNLSLRAGLQLMYLTSQAHAPDQLDFSPDPGKFSYTGDPFYQGAIFGLEGYW